MSLVLSVFFELGDVLDGLNFGAFCLDVITLTFCQLMGFASNHEKLNFQQISKKQPSEDKDKVPSKLDVGAR